MNDEKPFDEIKERYDRVSRLRNKVIDMLNEDEQRLAITIADKDAAKLLVKLLDGEDKQTIARQRNATDEKIVGVVGNGLTDIADRVIQGLGGWQGIRGEPDASKAPTEAIPITVEIYEGENSMGVDENLNYTAILGKA